MVLFDITKLYVIENDLFKTLEVLLMVLVLIFGLLKILIKKKFPILGLILLLIDVFIFLSQYYFPSQLDYIISLIGIEGKYVLTAFIGLTLIITFLCLVFSKKRVKNKDEKASYNEDNSIYFYGDSKGNVVKINDNFYDNFKHLEKKKANWYKAVKNVWIDDVEVKPKKFFSKINSINQEMTIHFLLVDGHKFELVLYCKENDNGKKGYVYTTSPVLNRPSSNFNGNISSRKKIFTYFSMIDLPLCYFDETKNVYICNKKMMELLEFVNQEVTTLDLQSKILNDDLSVFKTKMYNNSINKYFYRMRTTSGYLWFEEKTCVVDGNEYRLIVQKDKNPEASFKTYTYIEMISDIERCYQTTNSFAVMLLSFKNIPEYNNSMRVDNTEILVSKFFDKVSKITKTKSLRVYRFGDIEYGVLFEDYDEYQLMARGFTNGTSMFINCDVYLNDSKFTLKNKVGLVESMNMPQSTPEEMIKAALDALDVASDPEYKNDYCIYYPPKPRREAYNLSDYDIDLSESYLDSIYKPENKE